jgi:hypothetical protein
MSGKGSSPRPFSVTQDEFANNFDRIFRKDKRLEEEQLQEDEEFQRIAEQSKVKDSEQGG